MSSKRAPRCSATTCASVVSRPWPCEAMPKRGGDGAGRIDAHDRRLGAGVDRHAGRNRDARADAGQFGVAGDADADPAAGGARRFLLGAQCVVADRVASLVQAFVKAGFVPDDARGDLVGKLVVGNQIAQPDVLGIDAELCRRHVHQPFHDEGRDRPADAAIRSGRRFRGRHRLHPAAIILHPIGTGQKAHDLHRLEPRGPRIDRIGADVADHVGAQGENAAVVVERQFGVDDFVETLAAGGEVFQAVAGPFDRALQLPRRGANENFLRIERALAAKTAADVGRDDANAMARNIERRRQRIADDAGHLRCRMQRQRVAARFVFGEIGARLDRDRALAVHAEAAFDADRRRRKCGLGIAALELAADNDIGAGLVMQQRRTGAHRLFRIDHERQRFVIDGDRARAHLRRDSGCRRRRRRPARRHSAPCRAPAAGSAWRSNSPCARSRPAA